MWQYWCRSTKVEVNTKAPALIFSSVRRPGLVLHRCYFHSKQRKPSGRWCSLPTCRLEDQYSRPTLTYGIPPWIVGTTRYIWYMSMQFVSRLSNPYSLSVKWDRKVLESYWERNTFDTGAENADYPRYDDHVDLEPNWPAQSSTWELPSSWFWWLWGCQ